mgnify:CR=1 FL=1
MILRYQAPLGLRSPVRERILHAPLHSIFRPALDGSVLILSR